jgi:hypothetical protein
MERSQHVGAITELDLSACQPATLVSKINAVPGLRTSTGKFILRAYTIDVGFFAPFSRRLGGCKYRPRAKQRDLDCGLCRDSSWQTVWLQNNNLKLKATLSSSHVTLQTLKVQITLYE